MIPPSAPTGLTVNSEPAIAVLILSWTDNSSDETGFSIWRRHGTAPWARIAGYDDLNTDIYFPGADWVRAEIDYRSPDGRIGTAMSSWSPMTVLPAYPARLLFPAVLRPNSQASATVELTRPHRVLGSQPLVVTLTASHPDLVRVPASVSVERSARSAAFTFSTAPTIRTTIVTISASANGETISAPLTVSPF